MKREVKDFLILSAISNLYQQFVSTLLFGDTVSRR